MSIIKNLDTKLFKQREKPEEYVAYVPQFNQLEQALLQIPIVLAKQNKNVPKFLAVFDIGTKEIKGELLLINVADRFRWKKT